MPTATPVTEVGPNTTNPKSSGSFTAPANSVIVVECVVDTSGTTDTTLTVSNNGAPLTWQLIGRQSGNEAGARPGTVAAYYAVVATERTGLTVSLNSSITGRNSRIKPWIITDVDTSDPIGAVLEASVGTGNNVLNTTGLVMESSDSLAFVLANESEAGPGNPTSSTSGIVLDSYVSSGNHSGAGGYIAGGSAGSSVSFNIDAAGTSSAITWNYIAYEIRKAPPPPASNPAFFLSYA